MCSTVSTKPQRLCAVIVAQKELLAVASTKKNEQSKHGTGGQKMANKKPNCAKCRYRIWLAKMGCHVWWTDCDKYCCVDHQTNAYMKRKRELQQMAVANND